MSYDRQTTFLEYTVAMMTWSYIAGFLDGEGSITRNESGWRITIPQTHYLVLRSIQRFTRVGHITHLRKRQTHWREAWVYVISTQADIQRVLTHILPHLIVKHPLARKVLAELHTIVPQQRRRRQIARQHRITARRLRRKGLTYRAIGSRLGLDWGYVRRMILPKAR